MTDLNLIKVIFLLMTISMVFLGLLLNTIEKYLPVFVVKSIRYGKFAFKGSDKGSIKSIDVPKSWFKHFYVFASILAIVVSHYVFGSYICNYPVPLWLRKIVDILGNSSRNRETTGASLLATLLLGLQCVRRLYDTHFVSIFGNKSRMNLLHYIIGYTHYFAAFFAILVEAPNFTLTTNKVYYFRLEDIKFMYFPATLIFLYAWYKQYESTVILANLRKNPKGKKLSDGHFMPEGGWFKYVSSPHLLSEILMYISLTIILWNNSTWKFCLFWVLSNQIETALLSHWWYKETFKNYPKERKAIIPFIL